MKKIITTLCAAALLINMAALTGCNSNEEGSDTPNSSGGSSAITDSSDNSGNSEGSGSSDNSNNSDNSESDPEPQKPDGDPTFLTLPDGTPIYTSEITKYQNPSEFHGTHEQFPLEQFNTVSARYPPPIMNWIKNTRNSAYATAHTRVGARTATSVR